MEIMFRTISHFRIVEVQASEKGLVVASIVTTKDYGFLFYKDKMPYSVECKRLPRVGDKISADIYLTNLLMNEALRK